MIAEHSPAPVSPIAASLPERLLLWLVFGLIPLVILYGWLMGRIETRLARERAALGQVLQARGALFARLSAPSAFLPRWLGSWARRGQTDFQKFLQRLEERYPGSIRGIAWDGRGHLLELPGPGLFVRKAWAKAVPRYLLGPVPMPGLTALLSHDASARVLQGMFGKKIPLDQIFSLRNDIRSSVWLERECLLVQVDVSQHAARPGELAGGPIQGGEEGLGAQPDQHADDGGVTGPFDDAG